MIWYALVYLTFLAASDAQPNTCQAESAANTYLVIKTLCAEGKYAPINCIGLWCFCINVENGEIIDGFSTAVGDKDMMDNCKCAQRVAKGEDRAECAPNGAKLTTCLYYLVASYLRRKGPAPICTADGLYAIVQCQDSRNCNCVTKEAGTPLKSYQWIPNSRMDCMCAYAESVNGTDLNCMPNGNFQEVRIPLPVCGLAKRPTQCQLLTRKFAFNQTRQEPFCETDGTFSPIQCFENRCYCADRLTGKQIARYTFLNGSDDYLRADCRCARDEAIYKLSSETLNVYCMTNGNYMTCSIYYWQYVMNAIKPDVKPSCDCKGRFRRIQCSDEVCYCSNTNGHKIGNYRIPVKLATNKTCACALEEDRLRAAGTPGLMPNVCDPYGDYDKAEAIPTLVTMSNSGVADNPVETTENPGTLTNILT